MSTRVWLTVLAVGVLSAPPSAPLRASTVEDQASFSADQLVAWVWQRNPGIAERKAALEVSIHRIETEGSLDDPTLSYTFAPRTFGRAGQGLNQKIEFGQQLPWPGTLKARRAAATHRANAAREDVHALRLELAATAKAGYAELYFVQRALAIHHHTHELLGELKSVAETRYAAGKAPLRDVLQTEFELAKLDRHLLELTRIETEMNARINGLLNRAPSLHLPKADQTPIVRTLPTLPELERLALEAHPELRRLDAEIAANASEVILAEKAFYPDLRLIAGYNSLWDEVDKRPIIGLSLNVPLDRGKRREKLLGAKANVRRSESKRASEAAKLLAELARAHAGVVESTDSIDLYERSLLPLAAEFLDAALADYESGSGGFLSVITAEQQKLETEENLERSRADALRRFADLELWTGGRLGESQ